MSQAAAPRTRPGQQARHGDATGRKREELQREHSEELAARENEIALVNAEHTRSHDEDVIDPATREIIKQDGSILRMDADTDDAPRVIGTGDAAIEELDEPAPTPGAAVPDLNEKVVIRVNADLEDVTLGYGNVYSFIEGRRYRVPRWVADHLDSKGLIWH